MRVLAFELGRPPPFLFQPLPDVAAEERASQDAWREEVRRRVSTPAPTGATNLRRQGRQGRQAAAAAGFPVSHRYTPSRRAPRFLYRRIAPQGCLPQTHRLPSSFTSNSRCPDRIDPAVGCKA